METEMFFAKTNNFSVLVVNHLQGFAKRLKMV
jgi:hypothetical protein